MKNVVITAEKSPYPIGRNGGMSKKRYKYEVLIDGKWHYFKSWADLYNWAALNSEKMGRAEAIIDTEEERTDNGN